MHAAWVIGLHYCIKYTIVCMCKCLNFPSLFRTPQHRFWTAIHRLLQKDEIYQSNFTGNGKGGEEMVLKMASFHVILGLYCKCNSGSSCAAGCKLMSLHKHHPRIKLMFFTAPDIDKKIALKFGSVCDFEATLLEPLLPVHCKHAVWYAK
jgi:hypothetical protein